jgi:two-component system sensor histidine kinase FlrB
MSLNLSSDVSEALLPPDQSSARPQADAIRTLRPVRRPISDQIARQEADKLATRHSRLLEVLPAGVVVIDGEGRVQEANAVAIQLLGEPLSGERWIDIIQRAFKPQPGDGHDVSLRDGRKVHISTTPLGIEPGQIILLQDVTETRELQHKVSHLQRLSTMGEVSARLAHQIRTPLSSALLYLSPLLKPNTDEAVRLKFADRLKHSLSHMEQLIKDMLAFSKGGLADTAPVSVSTLLEETAQQSRESLHEHTVRFEVFNRVNDGYVYGCQAALISALNNLINNAIQACDELGQVQLIAERIDEAQQSTIVLSVRDTGKGFTQQEKEKILQPFYTTRANGTGLGLAVVHSIAKAHKGLLTIDSELGKGSTFSLRLPVYQSNISQDRNTPEQEYAV